MKRRMPAAATTPVAIVSTHTTQRQLVFCTMNPEMTGAITGPSVGPSEKNARAVMRSWSVNMSASVPALTESGGAPAQPAINRNT